MAWLSLDQRDRQPATFWTYVITALQTAVPGVGADVLPLLQSAQPPIETVLTTLLNELAAAPNEVWLVLDDYHLVDGPDVRDGMAFLLEHLPPHVHVVISTRADPDLPLARLAGARRAGRDPRRRPAFHLRRGHRLPQRRRSAWTSPPQTSPSWRSGPRAGSPRCSWPPSRCRAATDVSGFIARFAGRRPLHRRLPGRGGAGAPTRRGSRFPAAARRFSTGSPGRCVTPSPAATTAARCSSTLERANLFIVASGRPAGVVPLPPPVRRRAAGADAQRAAGPGSAAAPARQPVVRAPRPGRGGGPARIGRRETSTGRPT